MSARRQAGLIDRYSRQSRITESSPNPTYLEQMQNREEGRVSAVAASRLAVVRSECLEKSIRLYSSKVAQKRQAHGRNVDIAGVVEFRETGGEEAVLSGPCRRKTIDIRESCCPASYGRQEAEPYFVPSDKSASVNQGCTSWSRSAFAFGIAKHQDCKTCVLLSIVFLLKPFVGFYGCSAVPRAFPS